MAKGKIELTLEVDDKGTVVIKKFSGNVTSQVKSMSDKSIGHVKKLGRQFTKGLGGAISKIGSALTSLKTLAMGALAGWGVSEVMGKFAGFETALVDMGKVTKESFESIKKKVMDLPSALGSVTQLTKGYYQAISAGVKGAANQLGTLVTASRLAKTAHADQAQVIIGLSSTMDAFKVKSMEAADALQTIEKIGKTTVSALIPVIGELSSGSAALGISLNEMGAAFAAVTLQSGGTEKAATQYKALLVSLLAPTREMTELLSRYGGAQGAIKEIGFGGVMSLIARATKGNATETKKLMGSVEAYLGFLSASANDMKTYNQNLEEQKNKTGAVDRAWKDYKKTLSAIWDTFKNIVGKQLIWLGEKLAPAIKEVLTATGGWLEKNRELIALKLSGVISKITTASESLYGWITKNIEKAKDIAGKVKTIAIELGKFYVIAKLTAGLTGMIAFFKGLSIATNALTIKILGLTKAFKANLVAMAGYGAYKVGEQLSKWLWGDAEEIKKSTAACQEEGERYKATLAERIRTGNEMVKNMLAGDDVLAEGAAGAVRQHEDTTKQLVAQAQKGAREIIESQLKIAQADKKILEGRLSKYQSFYASLQNMIKKTSEQEKRHIQELNALYRQKADIQKNTEAMVRGLRETGMAPVQRYESQRSALNQQFMKAMRLSGQDQIKALEEYKKAVASLGQSFSQGVIERQTRFGQEIGQTVISSRKVIEDAVSDIERAAGAQQRALQEMEAEKQKQITADRQWADVLTSTANDVAQEIQYLQGVIGDLSTQIQAMQKTIEIQGIDLVSPVVDRIRNELESLHDKTVTITTIHRNIVLSGAAAIPAAAAPESYRSGTDYVPRTDIYMLHQGERVVPKQKAEKERRVLRGAAGSVAGDISGDTTTSRYNDIHVVEKGLETRTMTREAKIAPSKKTTINVAEGAIVINIPENAAPQTPEDWRFISREYVVAEIERLGNA